MVPARTFSLLATVFSAALTLGYGAVPGAVPRALAARFSVPLPAAPVAAGEVPPAPVAGQESRALAAMRTPEFDALAGAPRTAPRAELSRPVSVCGEGPERRVCEAEEGTGSGAADTGWLVGLRAPDLPVHASLRVERFFKYLTESTAGRKLFRAWLKRSGRYRDVVQKALHERGMPSDLEALVFIESGYSPTAVSTESAVGLWQFVPGTARLYGLAVDSDFDERRSVEKSTEAATRYLSDLYERFGSWELAMAAYDMGYGRLTRRVQDVSTNDYWTLSLVRGALPDEALAYVPKVLAVALLLRNLDRFGFDSTPIDPPMAVADLDVPGGTPLSLVARAAGTSTEQLRLLNPEILSGTVPDRAQALPVHVPVRGMVRANIMLPQLLSRWRPDDRQEDRVGDGFDWGIDELSPARHRAPRASVLMDDPTPVAAEDDADTAPAPERPALAEPREDQDAPAVVFYRVDDGETLPAIARRFGTRPSRIAADNHLDAGARLQKGMLLMVHAERSALSQLASMRTFAERSAPPMRVEDDGGRDAAAPPRAAAQPEVAPDLPPPLRTKPKRPRPAHALNGRRSSDVADLFARAKP